MPDAKDTGAKYKTHPISSGPYMLDGDFDASTGGTLMRNPNWDAATDPNRAALPDEIDVKLGLQADDLDNQIISGDQTSTSPAPACSRRRCPRCCRTPSCRTGRTTRSPRASGTPQIIPTVKPLDNIECRKAIMYAMSPTSYQNAYGGEFAGGEIATTILPPPMIPGYEDFDLYGQKDNPDGQPDKAKEALKKCGQPDGFETNIAYRASGPRRRPPPRRSSRRWRRSASRSTRSRCPRATTSPPPPAACRRTS